MQDESKRALKQQITDAFGNVEHPGDENLTDFLDDEALDSARAFAGKTDWRELDPTYIDQAPGGLGSALSFVSGAAFHFLIAAYMIADIDEVLERADPAFHLVYGLDDAAIGIRWRPDDALTIAQEKMRRFSRFTPPQAAAVDAYLCWRRDTMDHFDEFQNQIDQALYNYWMDRADPDRPA